MKRWQLKNKDGEKDEIETRIMHCSSKEDVDALLELFGREFVHSTFAKRYLPDLEKRKLFVPLYFRYLYEKTFSDGGSELFVVKARKISDVAGTEKVIAGWIYSYQIENKPADPGNMIRVYKEGAETMLKRDEWLERYVHLPMKKAALDLGMPMWLPAYQAVDKDYQKHNLNSYYMVKSGEMFMERGRRKWNIEKDEVTHPLYYAILSDCLSGALERFRALGVESVAHLHYNFKPGLVCCETSKDVAAADVSCYYILVDKDMVPILKNYFAANQSKL